MGMVKFLRMGSRDKINYWKAGQVLHKIDA